MATKFDMSPETKKILTLMEGSQPGEKFSYNTLRNLTGINDIDVLRGRFYTAANRAFRLWKMRFGCERGVGYFRLDETAKNNEVTHRIVGVRRRIKRTERYHEAVNPIELSAQDKMAHMVNAVIVSEMKRDASRGHIKKITRTVENNAIAQGMVDGTIELFRKMK